MNDPQKGSRSVEMIKFLLGKGADTKIRNGSGQTPLDLAKVKGRQSIIDAFSGAE
jgi:ankyrin repeat protein